MTNLAKLRHAAGLSCAKLVKYQLSICHSSRWCCRHPQQQRSCYQEVSELPEVEPRVGFVGWGCNCTSRVLPELRPALAYIYAVADMRYYVAALQSVG